MALNEEKFYKAIGEVKQSIADEAVLNEQRHGDVKVALNRIEQNEEDIKDLEKKSNKFDGILGFISIAGAAIGAYFGLSK